MCIRDSDDLSHLHRFGEKREEGDLRDAWPVHDVDRQGGGNGSRNRETRRRGFAAVRSAFGEGRGWQRRVLRKRNHSGSLTRHSSERQKSAADYLSLIHISEP